MKVHFPVIRNASGADVYFERLAAGLAGQRCQTQLDFYPHLLEFLPYRPLRAFLPNSVDCDIVHTKAEYGWLFASRGKPLVVTLAHSVFDPGYDPYKSVAQRLYHNLKVRGNIARSFSLADRIVTVSRFSARCIREGFRRDDVTVIYNGVDETFFHPAAEDGPAQEGPTRLLFVGNRTTRKGFDLLAPILNRLGPGFLLEFTSGLRSRRPRPPHPAMRSLGRLTAMELLAAYQRCDILLFPSRLEGFGYPVAEAMACGKPVVCTDYASLPELVDEGQGGYLCPPDDVETFAERVRELGSDPTLRGRMGAYNRAKAEREFSQTRCIEQYIALYRELV